MGGAGAEPCCRSCEGCGRGRVGLGGAAGLTGLIAVVGLDEGTLGLVSVERECKYRIDHRIVCRVYDPINSLLAKF